MNIYREWEEQKEKKKTTTEYVYGKYGAGSWE